MIVVLCFEKIILRNAEIRDVEKSQIEHENVKRKDIESENTGRIERNGKDRKREVKNKSIDSDFQLFAITR